MLVLSRPPYVRWGGAVLIVVAAFALEFTSRTTNAYPFAAYDIKAGAPLSEDNVEWRQVPDGTMSLPTLDGAQALVDVSAGDPLTPSVAGQASPIPGGWWSVPVSLPTGLPAGAHIRLMMPEGDAVDGIVSVAGSEDQYGVANPGMVAVPPDRVDRVATASASGALLVVVAP